KRYPELTVGALVQVLPPSVDLNTPPAAPPIPARTSGPPLSVIGCGPRKSSAQPSSHTMLSMLISPVKDPLLKLPVRTSSGAEPGAPPPRQCRKSTFEPARSLVCPTQL